MFILSLPKDVLCYTMLNTTRAIVLKTFAHGDGTVILKAWTSQAGLRSYVVRISKKNGISAAAIQPLNRVELVADERADRELQSVRELRVSRPYINLHRDPERGAIALFVQEVLHRVLRAEAADPSLDHFLHEALEAMDTVDDLRCFPHVFLIKLSGHLGFMPEMPEEGEDHFDLQEGCFLRADAPHNHTMGPLLSTVFIELLGRDLLHSHGSVIPTAQRRELLDHLLLYFRLHVDGLGELRSPAVLHAALA